MHSNHENRKARDRRSISRVGNSYRHGVGEIFVSLLVLAISGCNGSDPKTPAESPASTSWSVVNAVSGFGAHADGLTDDEPALQRALDFVAMRGGGVVYLPAGVYGITRPLVLRSHVQLIGEGSGKSIVRTLVHSPGKILEGTSISAAIALLSADQAGVSQLTVDLATFGTHANGIALLPTGESFEGAPSSNCVISYVEVLGGGNYHAYMIWNLRGRGTTITNNLIDGRVVEPGESYQEGIESYGGKDVVIGLNSIRNIGNTALNFGSAGIADTGIDGLIVTGNTVSNAGRGLNLGTWMGDTGPQNISNVQIENNNFQNLWKTGMYVPVYPGTLIKDVRIAGNTLDTVGSETAVGAAGIQFQGSLATNDAPAGLAINTLVTGNTFRNVRGKNSFGLLVNYFPGLAITDNVIDGVGYEGIQAFGSTNLVVAKNLIANTGRMGVGSYGSQSSISVHDNTIVRWAQIAPVAGVRIEDAVEGDVRNNDFQRDVPTSPVVAVAPTAANVVVFGNAMTSTDPSIATQDKQPDRFVNLGAESNLGSFVANAYSTSMEIANPLVKSTSHVIVEQLTGEELSYSVTIGSGAFDVVFEVVPKGDESFRYEIDP